jgi:hypothetical protein
MLELRPATIRFTFAFTASHRFRLDARQKLS